MNELRESINDKNLFKAVFMAGGPGSGKSFTASNMFGFNGSEVFSYTGAMLINSDIIFEKLLNQAKLPMKINANDSEIYDKQMDIRLRAKDLTGNKQDNLINGMLPLIIDGTGKDYYKITKQAKELKKLGYDVSMVFVNTSLDTALRRNNNRSRSVDPELVNTAWYQVQNNIGKFQEFFGLENFIVIDANNDYPENSEELENFKKKLYKLGSRLLERPLKNPRGIKIIKLLKASGKKYLSELPKDKKELKESCQKYLGCVPWILVSDTFFED